MFETDTWSWGIYFEFIGVFWSNFFQIWIFAWFTQQFKWRRIVLVMLQKSFAFTWQHVSNAVTFLDFMLGYECLPLVVFVMCAVAALSISRIFFHFHRVGAFLKSLSSTLGTLFGKLWLWAQLSCKSTTKTQRNFSVFTCYSQDYSCELRPFISTNIAKKNTNFHHILDHLHILEKTYFQTWCNKPVLLPAVID